MRTRQLEIGTARFLSEGTTSCQATCHPPTQFKSEIMRTTPTHSLVFPIITFALFGGAASPARAADYADIPLDIRAQQAQKIAKNRQLW